MDKISKEARSRNMSKITGKNTKPELIVRKKLYEMGYRYRLNVKDLPGKPDIVLRKLKKVILVHGCFWHRHAGCKFSTIPKTNTDFWHDKFNKTILRDKEVMSKITDLGWASKVIWECELKERNESWLEETLKQFLTKHILV